LRPNNTSNFAMR